jgi:Domain of unknown function (DUF5666)
MIRRALVTLSLVLAFSASAATRTVDSSRTPNAATVTGIVTSVSGNLIHLADGKVTIDATNAKVNTTVEPGMLLVATLSSTNVAANAPLPAETVTATRLPDATLLGPVQSVDTAASTLTILGRTIKITNDTSFGGIHKRRDGAAPNLGDILPNHLVNVTVDNVNGQLVAKSVLLIAPVLPEVHATRGEVKSIATDSWLIERERGDDLTLVIDANTKIAGSPKVGDTVEVLYRVDTNNANVAISIIKFERPPLPPIIDIFRFSGQVKTIDTHAWVIARESGDEKVLIDSNSKIEPGIKAGDRVEVLAQRKQDGTVTALAIVRRR